MKPPKPKTQSCSVCNKNITNRLGMSMGAYLKDGWICFRCIVKLNNVSGKLQINRHHLPIHSAEEIRNRILGNQEKVHAEKFKRNQELRAIASKEETDKSALSGNSAYVESLRKKGATKEGCGPAFGFLVIGIVVLLLVRSCGGCRDSSSSNCSDYDLEYAAQEFVERQLRHPKTANFSKMYGQDDAVVPSNGDNRWMVMGKVESQNSYGVDITNFYSVELSCDPNTGEITLVDVSMSNN